MKYKAAIFDLDGTLLNTLEDLWSAVIHTMDMYGYPHRTIMEVRAFVGNGVDRLIMLCLPGGENDPNFEPNPSASLKRTFKDRLKEMFR